jgi:hypothetical protein
MGKDQLVRVSSPIALAVRQACSGGARDAWVGLSKLEGLEVKEVVRGQLGPLVGPWALSSSAPRDAQALKGVCMAPGDAVLSVTLERLAPDVAQSTTRDPWAADEPSLAGAQLARERRLFCTPSVAAAVRALAGKQVLVRSA